MLKISFDFYLWMLIWTNGFILFTQHLMSSGFGILSSPRVDALLCVLMIRKVLEIASLYQTG